MNLIKCPRCELNYMYDNEKMCTVCKKDVRGEQEDDEMLELCSECGENPVVPGHEVCAFCLKEMQRRSEINTSDDGSLGERSRRDFESDSVSSMDEIEVDVDDENGESFAEDDDEKDPFEEEDPDDDLREEV